VPNDPTFAQIRSQIPTADGWRSGAVNPPTGSRLLAELRDLELRCPAFSHHRKLLRELGSQATYASRCHVRNADECDIALVRFSGAIESAFGLTREVMIFYCPYTDFQHRSFEAAKLSMRHLPRAATPDIILVWSPDLNVKYKLDDWSKDQFIAVPLPAAEMESPTAFLATMRDYILVRDLFYETAPVSGEKFFGRRTLLRGLVDDIQTQRVVGVFGLRKAGKTSILKQLKRLLDSSSTAFLLRDLESLPSPPDDPIPDLLAEILQDLRLRLDQWGTDTSTLRFLEPSPSPSAFKRALQNVLKDLARAGRKIILALDEVEYLVPSDRIDIHEGNMSSVSQFLGVLRSLTQENPNFTFMVSGLTSAIIESGRLYGRPNPLFSWAKPYYISPFTRPEADDLALSVGHRMGVKIEDGALEALHEASGGHAFLYRHLASTVVSELPVAVMTRRMTRHDVLTQLKSWKRDIAGHVQEMVDHVRRYYPSEAFLLETLIRDSDGFADCARSKPAELAHLLRLGLIEEVAEEEFAPSPVLLLI
jgi:hypothetical protein